MLTKEKITTINELLTRLYDYIEHGPLSNQLKEFVKEEIYDDSDENVDSDEKYFEVLQAFIFDYRVDGRNTPLEIFIKNHDDLTEEENAICERWKNSVHSIFEVKKLSKDSFNAYNLVNERNYTIRTLTNFQAFKGIGASNYIFCRIAPFEDYHILIGNLISFPRKAKKEMLEMAVMVQLENPAELLKDNPAKYQEVCETNSVKLQKFYDLFDSDQVFTSGEHLHDLLKIFSEYVKLSIFDKSKIEGKTGLPEEYYFTPDFDMDEDQEEDDDDQYAFSSDYRHIHDAGLIFDSKEGLSILPFYATFTKIFSSPNFKDIPNYKECVLYYLEDEGVSPLPFVKVITEYPVNSVKVFEDVLEHPGFSIEEDFNKLMETYKYNYIYNNQVSQTVIYDQSKAFNDLLKLYEDIVENMDMDELSKDFVEELIHAGRNDPCPCGSGKKFKKCCINKID